MARELPDSWQWVKLEDVGEIASGGTPKTSDPTNFDGPVAWITPADLTGYSQKYIEQGERKISLKGLKESSARILPSGTVLFSSRAPIGYVVIAANKVCTNQGFKNLIPAEGINSEFIYYYLKGSKKLAESMASGTTFLEISGRRFSQIPIPLAPLNEQRRIISKIEELFSDLDAGEAALRTTQQLLARYRQSVLKAAVTGELTRDWRAANQHRLESGEELLQRILAARRAQWNGRGTYKEPQPPDTRDLPELPEGWAWTRMEQLAEVIGGIAKNTNKAGGTLKRPMLRVGNVYQNCFKLDDIHEIGVKESELERVLLRGGDMLIVEGNGSKDQIGRMAIWKNQIADCVHQNHLIKARFVEAAFSKYILFWFMSFKGREIIERVASSTSGLHTLSISKVENLIVPLPSLQEANEIVSQIEAIFSQISTLESWCSTELARSATLRQSILKAAFSGQLVPQDPTDEPASMLLERIRAAREHVSNGKATRTGRPPHGEQMELL